MVPETNLNMLDQHWAPGPLKIALPQDMHFQYSLWTSALRFSLLTFHFHFLTMSLLPTILNSQQFPVTFILLQPQFRSQFQFQVLYLPFSNPASTAPTLLPPPASSFHHFNNPYYVRYRL